MSTPFNIEFMIKKGYVENPPGSGQWERPKKGDKKISPSSISPAKKHKYGAKEKNVNGVRYDSNREYEFKVMLDFNKIPYNMKEEYVLQSEFVSAGEKIKALKIIPDFTIYNRSRRIAIVDIKGMILPDFKIKTKLLRHKLVFELKQDIPIIMPTNKEEMADAIQTIHKLLK